MHNCKIHYKIFGEGQPIVFLHGILGDHSQWIPFVKEFSQYKVILPDLPNHGFSGHISSMNHDVISDILYEWILSLENKDIILVGHSFGGKIAMKLADRYPDIFRKIVLVDSPVSQIKSSADILHWINVMGDIQLKNYSEYRTIKEFLTEQNISDKETDLLLKNLKRENKNFSWKSNVNVFTENISSILEGVKIEKLVNIPALLLKGEKSGYVSDKEVEKMRKSFPFLEDVKVENSGHWIHVDNPKAFIFYLKSFFRQ